VTKFKTLKGACLVAATSMLPLSQAAIAEVSISGWINQGITFYDDGLGSDAVQQSDNGTTLGDRITFAASGETGGITAGMEVIVEPNATNNTPLIFSNQATAGDGTGATIAVLGNSLYVSSGWGKITLGLQSMPTDNIAVLEDPSLTLWSGISPVFRGNGFDIQGTTDGTGSVAPSAVWGDFLNCFTAQGLRGAGGIGIDCNGIYRNGIRYDLPAFGPVSVAVGYANDDIFDVSVKYKGTAGRISTQVAVGYAQNQGVTAQHYKEAENFQIQVGLSDPESGVFGSVAYQRESADIAAVTAAATPNVAEDTDAYWLKVGVKKQWFDAGDTSVAFDYGEYDDQYGLAQAVLGVNGSSVSRVGISIDQYFGSSLIVYGKWENLALETDCTVALSAQCALAFSGGDDLDTFTLGAVYFF
jgi:hypothetical protein